MDETLKRLHGLDHEIVLLEHAAALLGWDEETLLPSKGIDERSEQVALLHSIIHARIVASEMPELLSKLGVSDENPLGDDSLPALERSFLRAFHRRYRRAVSLPAELVTELARVTSKGQAVWREARRKNDFALFAPHLSRIVELTRQKARCYGISEHPYDTLLDEFEPWMKTSAVDKIFQPLKQRLSELAARIREARQVDDRFLAKSFPIPKQEEFGRIVLADMGFDADRGRLDVSAHPFTETLGFDDVRITARYDEHFLKMGMSSIIHEAGHALYEMGFPQEVRGSLLATGTSLGIHESQSRLWENIIGKSLSFWRYYFPILSRMFPAQLDDVSVERFYRAVNKVEPSLIRIEADEVTYGLHIVLRFELETSILQGDITVADAPAAWNDRMKELIGVRPERDADGILQDIHWSSGLIGYFPTYALGNLYGAQFVAKMREDLPGIDEEIEKGNLRSVLDWLRTRIHVHGAALTAEELCRRVTGKPLDPSYFLSYLAEKYSSIYGL